MTNNNNSSSSKVTKLEESDDIIKTNNYDHDPNKSSSIVLLSSSSSSSAYDHHQSNDNNNDLDDSGYISNDDDNDNNEFDNDNVYTSSSSSRMSSNNNNDDTRTRNSKKKNKIHSYLDGFLTNNNDDDNMNKDNNNNDTTQHQYLQRHVTTLSSTSDEFNTALSKMNTLSSSHSYDMNDEVMGGGGRVGSNDDDDDIEFTILGQNRRQRFLSYSSMCSDDEHDEHDDDNDDEYFYDCHDDDIKIMHEEEKHYMSNAYRYDNNYNNHNKRIMIEKEEEEEMKKIEMYLTHHHQIRQDNNIDQNIFNCNADILEDHRLYYYTNFANPLAMKQSFLYCIQTDDTDLVMMILRDVGIEYLLRHCMNYSGYFYESMEYIDRVSGNITMKASTTTSIKTSVTSHKYVNDDDHHNHTTTTATTLKSTNDNHKSANIFWLASLYGSSKVLELILEATWVHFAESTIKHDYPFSKCNDNEEPEQDIYIDYKKIEDSAKCQLSNILNDESSSSYGITPMFIASAMNHKEIISLLLQYGTDPNKTNNDRGTTPAIIAAARNNTDALQALSESELINFNQGNERNITPLLAACQSGSLDAVKFLTKLRKDGGNEDERIVNCQCQNSMGYGCASVAAQHNHIEVITYLCQIHDPEHHGIDINQRNDDKDGDTAIHVAVRFNRCSVIKALLEMSPCPCEILESNKMGMSALHIAANLGYSGIVVELMQGLPLESMSSFDKEDLYGMTPILYASIHGFEGIVNVLAPLSDIHTLRCVQMTKKKQDTKRKIFAYQNPLHVATCHGYLNIIYTLLHCGADINQTDSGGHTALSLAAKLGLFEIVKVLVDNGADVKIKSKRGKTPLAKARKYRRLEIVEFLEQYTGK